MSSPRVHDPLFHFETHFPERLSRLHLNPEIGPQSPNRRNKRTRARHGIRYKTQPVTFDEITEVDEENVTEENNKKDGIKNQFQAFSRSMDGLVPKFDTKSPAQQSEGHGHPTARRTRAASDAINRPHSHYALESRLQEEDETSKENKENEPEDSTPSTSSSISTSGLAGLPPSGHAETRDPRRQRMTAKAKRRQMMAEAVEKES